MGFLSDFFDGLKNSKSHNISNVEVNNLVDGSNNKNGLVVFAPKNVGEVNKIIDCVANGQTLIVNMGNIRGVQFQEISDYLSGALYALKADINCLQDNLYIVTPQNVKLSTIK